MKQEGPGQQMWGEGRFVTWQTASGQGGQGKAAGARGSSEGLSGSSVSGWVLLTVQAPRSLGRPISACPFTWGERRF
jgi:hypothetical protein